MSNKVNIHLSPKPNDDERIANEHTRYLFIMAMMNMDDKMIMRILDKDASFFGKLNNWQAANWLRTKFKNFDAFGFHSKFKFGFSNEIYPGAEVFEFTYSDANFDELDGENKYCVSQSPNSPGKNEIKLRLVIQFKNRKVTDIRLVKNLISSDNMKKFENNN